MVFKFLYHAPEDFDCYNFFDKTWQLYFNIFLSAIRTGNQESQIADHWGTVLKSNQEPEIGQFSVGTAIVS